MHAAIVELVGVDRPVEVLVPGQPRQAELDGPVTDTLLSTGQRAGEPVPVCIGKIRNAELANYRLVTALDMPPIWSEVASTLPVTPKFVTGL